MNLLIFKNPCILLYKFHVPLKNVPAYGTLNFFRKRYSQNFKKILKKIHMYSENINKLIQYKKNYFPSLLIGQLCFLIFQQFLPLFLSKRI